MGRGDIPLPTYAFFFNVSGVISVRSTVNYDAIKRRDQTSTFSHVRNQINEVPQSSNLDFAVGVLA